MSATKESISCPSTEKATKGQFVVGRGQRPTLHLDSGRRNSTRHWVMNCRRLISENAARTFTSPNRNLLDLCPVCFKDEGSFDEAWFDAVISPEPRASQNDIQECGNCGDAEHVAFCIKPSSISKSKWQGMSDDARYEATHL